MCKAGIWSFPPKANKQDRIPAKNGSSASIGRIVITGKERSVINIDAEAPPSESSALTKAVVEGYPWLQAPKFSEQAVKKRNEVWSFEGPQRNKVENGKKLDHSISRNCEADVDVIDPLQGIHVYSGLPPPPPIEQAVYSKAAALNSRLFAESPPSSKSVCKYQLVWPTDR
jgi:hypothetical protein